MGRSLLVVASALLLLGGEAIAADSPKLSAPIYKGAVPAVLAKGVKIVPGKTAVASFGGVKALNCNAYQGLEANGPWCFLTRDPIDKVKAFYDRAIGPMHAIHGRYSGLSAPARGYEVFTERAWFKGREDAAPGYEYSSVSLHALPPPPVKGKEAGNTSDSWQGQVAYKFYVQTRHFGGFIEAVDWFGDPTKRKPAELDAVYKKHKRIESALYQRKGPKSEPVDATLRARFGAKQKQGMEKAQRAMIPSQAQILQMQQAAQRPMPANQSATPEDAEYKAFMKRNPEVAKKYVALTQKMGALMQQGRMDEADKVDEELQALVNSHPELAAIERRADERSAAISATNQARENQAAADQSKQFDKAVWGTWMKYIGAAEKKAYYTLIVIDSALTGYEKDYTRDHGLIARETAGTVNHTQVLGFQYEQRQGAQAMTPAAARPGPTTVPAAMQSGQGNAPAAEQPKQEANPVDDLKGAAQQGLEVLKKLF